MARKTDFMLWLWGDLKADRYLGRKADALVDEMKIQQQLVAMREMSGLSQSAAAKRLGTSQPYIAKLETGVIRNPGVKTLVKYATALGGRVTLRIDPVTAASPLRRGLARNGLRPVVSPESDSASDL
jgi:DNA-binding XRE family transcriptional regulator